MQPCHATITQQTGVFQHHQHCNHVHSSASSHHQSSLSFSPQVTRAPLYQPCLQWLAQTHRCSMQRPPLPLCGAAALSALAAPSQLSTGETDPTQTQHRRLSQLQQSGHQQTFQRGSGHAPWSQQCPPAVRGVRIGFAKDFDPCCLQVMQGKGRLWSWPSWPSNR